MQSEHDEKFPVGNAVTYVQVTRVITILNYYVLVRISSHTHFVIRRHYRSVGSRLA